MGAFVNIAGQIFNGVEVVEYAGNGYWKCKCTKCGLVSLKRSGQLKKHGCNCGWKNTINEDYFKEIDTREKAYFLGFLWADGYNSVENKTCKIDLQERDIDFLEKLKEATDFSGKINSYIAQKGKSYRSEEAIVYRIHITNMGFIKNLYDKGVTPHRETSSFPEKEVPKEYFLDFVRGYFDGNGCCSICNGKDLMVNICGGTNILHDIGDILFNDFEIRVRYHRRRPENPDNDTLYITGRADMIKFLKLLYQDAPVYLDRKYNKYLEALKKFDNK